jgi:ABC-type transport system involved in multi-copper enzyme maturation permease subunit
MNDAIDRPLTRIDMIKLLVIKDLQIYQKQLAAFVAGMILALSLIGMGEPWSFAVGSLLLLVLLISVGSFSIQTLLVAERKEQTVPFIMSLPVTPMDYYWGKLLGSLAIYLMPFTVVAGGSVALVLGTPLPDGLVIYILLISCFLLMCFCVTLCIAIAVSSEAWIMFTMMALMTLVGPYMYGIGQVAEIGANLNTDNIVWSRAAVGLLIAELAVTAIVLGVTSWVHARKTSFL